MPSLPDNDVGVRPKVRLPVDPCGMVRRLRDDGPRYQSKHASGAYRVQNGYVFPKRQDMQSLVKHCCFSFRYDQFF